MPSRVMKFAAYLDNLRLGTYAHRENAGRRLLAVKRRYGGTWRKMKDGAWKNTKTGHQIRIKRLYA